METSFQRTKLNTNVGHLVEMVSTKWLLSISNPDKTFSTDDCNGKEVDDDELFADILKNGMRDPLIVGVGSLTKKVRLESGNHRARLFNNKGIVNVPAVAYINLSSITNTGNGVHAGIDFGLNEKELMNCNNQYKKLSDVLIYVPYDKELKPNGVFIPKYTKW